MVFEFEQLVAGIVLVVGIISVAFAFVATRRLRGSTLYWASALVLVTGIFFVAHVTVDVVRLGEGLYAVTALVVTFLLGFTLVVIDITTQMLGEES